MLPLLLASVLGVGVGQLLFAFVVWWGRWYAPVVRAAVIGLTVSSSMGAIWFVASVLIGAEGIFAALVYQGGQALALWLIVLWRIREGIKR